MSETTLSIVKPDAVCASHIGEIIHYFEANGLTVVGLKMLTLTKKDARAFYKEHEGKPFYAGLVEFMTSAPVVVMALSGNNAVNKTRRIMGATDYREAKPDTIRRRFAGPLPHNVVHGSDSAKSAKREVAFFFKKSELFV